jgi:Family of unknown function (DUF6516)
MSDPLRTPEDYELFVYAITENFPSVQRSTITFVRKGTSLARVAGELYFRHNIRVVVRERLIYSRLPAIIDWYGYEIWCGTEKLYWYDPQPHPNEANLQSTHPHHKHIPPDIKHNRIPAPNMGFTKPNLPEIILEVEQLIAEIEEKSGHK